MELKRDELWSNVLKLSEAKFKMDVSVETLQLRFFAPLEKSR